jgi:hypothetical protein
MTWIWSTTAGVCEASGSLEICMCFVSWQAVYLQREFNVAESSAGLSKSMDLNMLDLENLAEDSSRDLKRTKDLLKDESGENKGKVEDAALSDEGLDKIMSFLKNRMPHVKLKVFKASHLSN